MPATDAPGMVSGSTEAVTASCGIGPCGTDRRDSPGGSGAFRRVGPALANYRAGMTNTDMSTFGGRLLIGATGSAAVASLPMYISALRTAFSGTITVLMTHTATVFVPPYTVGLFADRVVTGTAPAEWAGENHATLAAEHDMMVVLPATANMLSVAATGSAPNMLAATITAAEFPVVFVPVMSGEMWQKPAVQRNVDQLRLDGYHVTDPPWGQRYDVGLGRFVETPMPPDPPQFIDLVRQFMPAASPTGG